MDVESVATELAEQAREVTVGAPTLFAFVGPTASGKTELAVAFAERVGGEIVSADSVQIYRGFDIGSGKPSAQEVARAPHHMIGAKDPHDAIDAAEYANEARRAIDEIRSRNRTAVVCGGTFLWVRALLYGLAEAPKACLDVRARHASIVEARGRGELHRMLAIVDAKTAARLHPNDQVRVSRALEVFELTGETLSAIQDRHGFRETRYAARLVARRWAPLDLTARIESRVHAWLEAGWIEEVNTLREGGYETTRAMGSVGYKEVLAHLRGELPRFELAAAITRATRVFARRQRTWLNHSDVTWV